MELLEPASRKAWDELVHPYKYVCSDPSAKWEAWAEYEDGDVYGVLLTCTVRNEEYGWRMLVRKGVHTWWLYEFTDEEGITWAPSVKTL